MNKIIKRLISSFLDTKLFILYFSKYEFINKLSRFNIAPSYEFKKKLFDLYNLSDGVWVETGTYLGDSTDYLSKISKKVYSIEPSKAYFKKAQKRFMNTESVSLFYGTSEICLDLILKKIENKKISFWLDGHFSYGDTYEGENHSPVLIELDFIKKNINSFESLNILIDDFRIFNKYYPKSEKLVLPSVDEIINWAQSNNFYWKVKRNILIMIKK
tara:strand:+ start:45 stop:689 length:645 start_codon:yes stop_codon:yes gene_type:complete